jgi:restriction system protein
MQRQERNLALEIVRGAFAAIWLPISWAAGMPSAALSLVRRSRQSSSERGQSARRAGFDTGKWTLELLKNLEWRRFEELCAAYFEALGFRTDSTHARADGCADIGLFVQGAGGASDNVAAIVHCKAWNAYPIGIRQVRELHGVMASAKAGEGVLVTSGRFTQEAQKFAAKENIQLIDGAGLLGKLAGLVPETTLALLKLATKGDFLTPTCPCCSIKMTARKSTGEGRPFWGCQNYPRCKHTFSGTVSIPA